MELGATAGIDAEEVKKIVVKVLGGVSRESTVFEQLGKLQANVNSITTLLKEFKKLKANVTDVKRVEALINNKGKGSLTESLDEMLSVGSIGEEVLLEVKQLKAKNAKLRGEFAKLKGEMGR